MSEEELQDRIVELESAHEELELDHHIAISLLLAFIIQMYWHIWYITVPLSILIFFILRKFFAKKLAATSLDQAMARGKKKQEILINKIAPIYVEESREELGRKSIAELEGILREVEQRDNE